jgi:hypothetical protein
MKLKCRSLFSFCCTKYNTHNSEDIQSDNTSQNSHINKDKSKHLKLTIDHRDKIHNNTPTTLNPHITNCRCEQKHGNPESWSPSISELSYNTSSDDSCSSNLLLELSNNNTYNKINNDFNYIFKKYKSPYKHFFLNYYIQKENKHTLPVKIVIFDHYGSDTKLPVKGWLHHCLYCNTITGRDMLYTQHNNINIHIQFCAPCQYYKEQLSTKKIDALNSHIEKVLDTINHKTFYI